MLLKKTKVNYLYSLGMLLNSCSFIPLLYIKDPTFLMIFTIGLSAGIGNGLYWSNRHYMTILSTENRDRNYIGGIESMLSTSAYLLGPAFFGGIFLLTNNNNIGQANFQYQTLIAFVFLLFSVSVWNILNGQYQKIFLKRFIYFKYNSLWKKQSIVNILEGITEGVTYTIPPILILMLIGEEDALGIIETTAVALSTIPVYLIGRYTQPRHRVYLLSLSVISFLIGTAVLALNFSSGGVLIFYSFNKLAFILNSFVYVVIRLKSIDVSKSIENRDEYAYIFNAELYTEMGRLTTIMLFCFLFFIVSRQDALRYLPFFVAIFQLIAIPIVNRMKQD